MRDDLPSIEFLGQAGITCRCVDAVIRLVQTGVRFESGYIITHKNEHALILVSDTSEVYVIRSGFASGYNGEGPDGLAYVLKLLGKFDLGIREHEVSEKIFEKLNSGRFSRSDLDKLVKSQPVLPHQWRDYYFGWKFGEELWNRFPPIIPFRIIDSRLMGAALQFWENPKDHIFQGYCQLEDILRRRCKVEEHGSRLFSTVFLGDKSHLTWEDLDTKEQAARANFFISAYGAFRNPRAHKILEHEPEEVVSEFLVLNQLYRLERDAVDRPSDPKDQETLGPSEEAS
jgi:hypothetical protein